MDRQQLRRALQKQRQNLSPQEHAIKSAQIAEKLFNAEFFRNSLQVACYFSLQDEVSTHLILQGILAENKHCYLPRLTSIENKQMEFVRYYEDDPLKPNQYGILEPCKDLVEVVKVDQLDLVLAPLVAFDSLGNRLGMGAGYYDRALANKKQKPFYCGLAYAFQQVEQLANEAWDVSLQAVVTEKQVLLID